MRGYIKNGVFNSCDEVCGMNKGKRSKGDTWWWNDEVKVGVSKKKDAHKTMINSSEENKRRHKSTKNKTKKTASKAMREKAEEAFTELKNCPNKMF